MLIVKEPIQVLNSKHRGLGYAYKVAFYIPVTATEAIDEEFWELLGISPDEVKEDIGKNGIDILRDEKYISRIECMETEEYYPVSEVFVSNSPKAQTLLNFINHASGFIWSDDDAADFLLELRHKEDSSIEFGTELQEVPGSDIYMSLIYLNENEKLDSMGTIKSIIWRMIQRVGLGKELVFLTDDAVEVLIKAYYIYYNLFNKSYGNYRPTLLQ